MRLPSLTHRRKGVHKAINSNDLSNSCSGKSCDKLRVTSFVTLSKVEKPTRLEVGWVVGRWVVQFI